MINNAAKSFDILATILIYNSPILFIIVLMVQQNFQIFLYLAKILDTLAKTFPCINENVSASQNRSVNNADITHCFFLRL